MKSILQVFSFNIVSKIIMGVTGILLIRYMSLGEYARFTLAFSMMTVVTQALTISFNRIYIVGHRSLRLENSSSPFLGFQLLGILLLALAAYPWMGDSGTLYLFTVAATIATCFSEFTKTFFQEKMKFISFSSIELARAILIALGTLAGIYFLRDKLTAWEALSIQAFAMGVIFLVVFARQLDIRGLLRINEVLRLARVIIKGQFAFLFGYYFIFSFFGQLNVFMLRTLSDDATVATYGSAFRYYTLIIMALSSAHAVLLPMIQKTDLIAEIKLIFRKFAKLALVFTPIVLAGAWASQWIIPAIDAGKYPQAITVFRILAVSAIISFALSPHVNLVMRYEKFRFLFFNVIIAIFMSVGLNAVLIPLWGAVGTAISTLISFAFVNGSIYLMARRLLRSNIVPPGDSLAADEAGENLYQTGRSREGLTRLPRIEDIRPYVIKIRLKIRELARRIRRPVRVTDIDKFFSRNWRGEAPDRNYFLARTSPRFFFGPSDKCESARILKRHFPRSCKDIIDRAQLILEHKFDLLGSGQVTLGQQIDWHTDFKSGKSWPQKHFTKVQLVDSKDSSDVKIPWELSRLQFMTDLGRAFWLTNDAAYKYEFKSILFDWETFNPVDIGVNWTCSMEVAIRAVNILWGLHFFRFDDSENEFVKRIIRSLYYHGRHIEKNLEDISRGANSNHLISDYLGLFYLGVLLPELKCSSRWKKLAQNGLENEIALQVFPDGADYECSTSYHRLVLEIFLSAYILGKGNDINFSENYLARLDAMLNFSETITAPSGLAPLTGDNDDGFIVKLSTENPADHRWLVDIGHQSLGKRSSAAIPIAEERLWYLGPETLSCANDRKASGSHLFENSGYAVIRGDGFHLLYNAAGVPRGNLGGHKHNDILSITLELDGVPYLIDPGTFCYSADFDLRNLSRSIRCHNTVMIDDAEQNRFLPERLFYLRRDAVPKIDLWTKTDDSIILSALHDGYKRLDGNIVHCRTLTARPAMRQIHIKDDFTGEKGKYHKFSLQFVTPILDITKIDRAGLEINEGKSKGLYIKVSEEGIEDLLISPIDYYPSYGIKAPAMLVNFIFCGSLPFGISTEINPMKPENISSEKAEMIKAAV